MFDFTFFKNKKVFITGHTGFKGSWLCKLLLLLGADITGYSLEPDCNVLYNQLNIDKNIKSYFGDIRDFDKLSKAFINEKPEIVFHLAAQPLVRTSYINPVYTFETNVMGTVNMLECIRVSDCVRSFLNVTTDKVYKNEEWEWGYRENDELGGYDPYSNSKSCSELVTFSYKKSYLIENGVAVSTARAGNVIGGGDYADNRIIPDCVRAACLKKDIVIRNPYSIRPYQHVIEPLLAYLMIAGLQYGDISYSDAYNVGPNQDSCIKTGELVDLFVKYWGNGIKWTYVKDAVYHESGYLMLDNSKIKSRIGWNPICDIDEAVEKTVEWYKYMNENENMIELTEKQIKNYLNKMEK